MKLSPQLRKRALNCAALLLTGWVMWHVVRPNVYLFVWTFQIDGSDHSPETDAADVRRLASLGPDVIGPILRSIKANTPWSKRTSMLPFVLKEIGPPAHERLMAAIQRDADADERSLLIYTLQESFDDYTFLPLYLDAIASGQSGPDDRLRHQLILFAINHVDEATIEKLDKGHSGVIEIPETPRILLHDFSRPGGKFNPDFVKWYALISKPKGPLPYWRPRQPTKTQT